MSQTPAKTPAPEGNVVNGVDVQALLKTVAAIKDQPDLGQFHFRAENHWIDAGHSQSRIKDFYGAGADHTDRTRTYVFDADEPPVLLGKDKGANPVEYLLHALVACLTTTMVFHAASRGIAIESVDSCLEGDIDVRGFLGLTNRVPKGYSEIRVNFRVKSDAPAEKLKELAQFSPVFNTVINPTPVNVTIEKVD